MYLFIYENRRMKPVQIVLRRRGGRKGKMMKGTNLIKYIVSTYVHITMHPPVKLVYANKCFF
jgi:hypothetical protein